MFYSIVILTALFAQPAAAFPVAECTQLHNDLSNVVELLRSEQPKRFRASLLAEYSTLLQLLNEYDCPFFSSAPY